MIIFIVCIEYFNHFMKPQIRQQQIIARLRAIQKEWEIDELADAMQVSAITIRRDLKSLAQQGVIIQTCGGCLIDNRSQLTQYHERVAKNFQLKQAIGRTAAGEIHRGDVLLINDGSTAFQLAGCLDKCGPVTVYTNSVVMIGEISRFPNVRLNILGGEYHADYFYLGGSLLGRVLETISADIAFLGTDSISPEGGCFVLNEDTARVGQLMMRQARRCILLADHTKVEAKAQVRFAGLKDFDLWITTRGLPRKTLNLFKRQTKIKEVSYEH